MNSSIFSTVILTAYLVRAFFVPVTLFDCIVLLLLSSVYGFINYLSFKQEKRIADEEKEKINKDINELKSKVEIMNSKFSAISLATSSRMSVNGR